MAQPSTPSILNTDDRTFETLEQGIAQLQAWLSTQGFPKGYTVTVSTDTVVMNSSKYSDPRIKEVYQECTSEAIISLALPFQFLINLVIPVERAIYLIYTLKRTRMTIKRCLELLYELGHILLLEIDLAGTEDFHRLLGWTKRQYSDKIKVACRVFRLYFLAGTDRIHWTTIVTPHLIQHMKEEDFRRLLQDIANHQDLTHTEIACPPSPQPEQPLSPRWIVTDLWSSFTLVSLYLFIINLSSASSIKFATYSKF